MNVEVEDIKEYLNNKDDNIYNKVFLYSVVVGLLLVLIICLISLIKKEVFYKGILVIDNNEVIMCVNYNDINNVIDNNELYINNKKYSYSIISISIIEEKDIYYSIKININLGLYNIDNNLLEYKILINEESILRYIVRVIKGG